MNAPAMLLTDDELTRVMAMLGAEPSDAASGFGTLSTPQGALPLKALRVEARIDGLLVRIELAQTYVNTAEVALEATYIFPLPDRSAVTAFRMEVAGRTVSGVLQERGQARAAYQKAIDTGHRAAIAEEERPDVFTLRVGNLMPGETATVHLVLAEVLPYADGEATFRFPLVVAPRYIPGLPLPGPAVGTGTADDTDAVPDASRISPPVLLPGWPSPVSLEIEVELCGGPLGVGDIRSSLHGVWLEEGQANGDGVHRLRVLPGHKLDRDFVLRYRLAGDQIRSSLSLHPDGAGKKAGGTFALTLVPPTEVAHAVTLRPRRVAFVLDRSGSMEGWKMVAARRAVEQIVATLLPSDAFSVLAFDTSIETPWNGDTSTRPATARAISQAREFLSRVEARGGTELDEAIRVALESLTVDTEGRDRLVVLVTDGQVGDENRLLERVGRKLGSVRFLTLGIDQAVNAGLLRRLAETTGGVCELVESEARLEERMEAIHRLMARPVLLFEKLEPMARSFNFEVDSFVPRRNPDLFPGSPVLLLGRYQGEPRGTVRLCATGPDDAAWSTELTPRVTANPAVVAAWARGRIRLLEDDYVVVSDSRRRATLEKELVALSLAHGVLCRFTAYAAIDESEAVNAGGRVLSVTQAVETPAGWEAAGMACASMPMPRGVRAFSLPSSRRGVERFAPAKLLCRVRAEPPASLADLEESLSDMLMPASAPPQDGLAGTCPAPETGRFLNKRPTKSGALGCRYQAFDRDRGTEVELEIIPCTDPTQLAAIADEYRVEAAAIQMLGHPAVVPILDVVVESNGVTVVRPLLAGEQLLHPPLEPAEAARIVAELAEIVEHVQAHVGILQGMTYDSIRIAANGHVQLVVAGRHTIDPAQLAGSLALTAPEQLTSGAPTTAAATVYRLGAVLYRLLTRREAIASRSGRLAKLPDLMRLLKSGTWAPVPPRKLNRKIPAALEAICLRAIALEPGKRPASAGALAAELRIFLDAPQSRAADRKTGFWK
jgi:Ca-activated chloride channel family protein